MDGEGGPQGCIYISQFQFHLADQPMLRFQVGLEYYQPAFLPVLSTLGIHQSDETSQTVRKSNLIELCLTGGIRQSISQLAIAFHRNVLESLHRNVLEEFGFDYAQPTLPSGYERKQRLVFV